MSTTQGVDVLDLTRAAAAVARLALLLGRIDADDIRAARIAPTAPPGTLLIAALAPDAVRPVLLDLGRLVEARIARAMSAPAFADTQIEG